MCSANRLYSFCAPQTKYLFICWVCLFVSLVTDQWDLSDRWDTSSFAYLSPTSHWTSEWWCDRFVACCFVQTLSFWCFCMFACWNLLAMRRTLYVGLYIVLRHRIRARTGCYLLFLYGSIYYLLLAWSLKLETRSMTHLQGKRVRKQHSCVANLLENCVHSHSSPFCRVIYLLLLQLHVLQVILLFNQYKTVLPFAYQSVFLHGCMHVHSSACKR